MKEEFLYIYNALIARPGADKLLEYLEKSSFFDDPASSRQHLSAPGGLCQHSINVYKRMKWLCEMETLQNPNFQMPSDETIAIVGLLHDLCKIGCYRKEPKNQKTYDPEKVAAAQRYQVKHDSLGDFIWETVLGYKFDDPLPIGHGAKSVIIILKMGMDLTRDEIMAIMYHMGSWTKDDAGDPGKAYEMCELALLLHMADEFATFVEEKETT